MAFSTRRLCVLSNGLILAAMVVVLVVASIGDVLAQKPKKVKAPKSKDTGIVTGAPLSESLVQFMVNEKSAPTPEAAKAVVTTLPLKLNAGEHVVFVGNTLFDYAQDYGYFEAMVQQSHAKEKLVIRNLSWSADEVSEMPRPADFGSLDQHLAVQGADVIFAAYGFNESFKGTAGVAEFRENLGTYLEGLKTKAFNGNGGARIVLVSPIANEDVEGVDAGSRNNQNLDLYTRVMAEVAAEQKVGFVDVFTPTLKAMTAGGKKEKLTFNGIHLEDAGYQVFANALYRGAFGKKGPVVDEGVRLAVLEKNTQFHYRYRPVNSFYYVGGRSGRYGFVDFLPAMERLDVMILNRDARIWTAAEGKPLSESIDDSNAPPLPAVTGTRGANEWMSPEDEMASFEMDERFEVNCFASEEDFPELACPIQIRWDSAGRLWVSTSKTYPHIYPGNEPDDSIIILEDTNGDGKADKCTTFAEGLHIPLSFEFGDGGVYVSEQPHMTFLKDTDGDGKADFRRKVLTGFGTEDSHHALHDMVWSPDGDLIGRDSIFLHSQVETPYGPQRLYNSGWWRYRPSNQKLTTFGMYTSTNPWGVVYDDWGQHQASHPIFASAFHALTPAYPDLNPKPSGLDAYSGTCGADFVNMGSFPADLHGGFVKARYKPTNKIEYHEWNEELGHYDENRTFDILFSKNLSFIPVDLRFGPRGALYVCDWYNPVKGHSQYSLLDSRRDRKSGRIWRITAKGLPLIESPKIGEQSIEELLKTLERPETRIRYWARRELWDRDAAEVKVALDRWLAGLDRYDARYRHHQVEALWLYRAIGESNVALLKEVLGCDEHHARAAATRQLRYFHAEIPNATALLKQRANDENGLVRLEAAIAASYFGTPKSLQAVADVMKHPRDEHIDYAFYTALNAHTLKPRWEGNATFASKHPEVVAFMNGFGKELGMKEDIVSSSEAAFDTQGNVLVVEIGTIPERMMFDVREIKAKVGQPIKIILKNPDATPHNLVITKPGQGDKVGMMATEMAKDPVAAAKGEFIPETDKILFKTKMIGEGEVDVLRFMAPKKPGVYPYVCTFPGHWVMMRGVLIVE